jgi:hypothetical protein
LPHSLAAGGYQAGKTSSHAVFSYELQCRRCGWRTVCGPTEAADRLRLLGLLRREPKPDDELVAALLVEAAPRMTCPVCKEKTLCAAPADSDESGDWQAAVLCRMCGKPVAPERLEAVPGAARCAACQEKAETGKLVDVEPEYCPYCGALVELRVSRATGITRYKRFCTGNPPCRL